MLDGDNYRLVFKYHSSGVIVGYTYVMSVLGFVILLYKVIAFVLSYMLHWYLKYATELLEWVKHCTLVNCSLQHLKTCLLKEYSF